MKVADETQEAQGDGDQHGQSRPRHPAGLLASLALAFVLALALALALGLSGPALAATDSQSSYYLSSSYSLEYIFATQTASHTFSPSFDGRLDRIGVYVARETSASVSDLELTLTTTGNSPATLATVNIPDTSVAVGSPDWVVVTLPAPVPVAEGTQYAVQLGAPGIPLETTCDGGSQCNAYEWLYDGLETWAYPATTTTTTLATSNLTNIPAGTTSYAWGATASLPPGGLGHPTEGAISFAIKSSDETAVCASGPVQIDTDGSASGVCTFSTPLPAAGSYTTTAIYSDPAENYASSSDSGTLLITQAPAIHFGLSNLSKTYGDGSFSIASLATSNSTGALSFVLGSGSSGCSVTSDGTVTINSIGTCVITVSQAAKGDYTAGVATSSFAIDPAQPTIDWMQPDAITYGTTLSNSQLDASATGLGGAALSGTFTYQVWTGTGTPQGVSNGALLPAGSYTLWVSFTPDDANYAMVDSSPASGAGPHVDLTVDKATPVIVWPAPAAITYGTQLSSTQLDAYADGVFDTAIPGIAYYDPAGGAILAAGPQHLSVEFDPTDSSNYTTATKTVSLQVNPATVGVTASNQVAAVGAGSVQLQATLDSRIAGLSGTVTFTVTNSQGQQIGDAVTALVSSGQTQVSATFDIPSGTPTGSYTVTADFQDTVNDSAAGLGSFQLEITNDIRAASGQPGQPIVVRRGFWALVELQLTDAEGHDVSSRTLKLTAENLAPAGQPWDGTNPNFVHPFQYGPSFGGHGRARSSGGYRLFINTRPLSLGDYTLSFSVEGDPVIHSLTIRVVR